MKRFWTAVAIFVLWLGASTQAQTGLTATQGAFPPVLRVGSQLTFELRQRWTGTVSGKNADGDWTGQARAADGTQGSFFGFTVSNSSNYAFQVGTTAQSEYCILTPSSANAGNGVIIYTGSRFSQQGNNNPVNDNTACRVILNQQPGGGTITQPPAQPPVLPGVGQTQLPPLSFPPRLAVGQRWELRFGTRPIVYRGTLAAQENRSGTAVFTGTLITDGQGDPIASRKLEAFMSGDTFAIYATDPQGAVTVCSFAGTGSLQNNVLTGAVFFRTAGQAQFSTLTAPDSAPCRANLEPTQAANPIQPPQSTTQAKTSLPAQVGDTWRIEAVGNTGLEPWVLSFSRTDPDGALVGTVTQSTGRGEADAFKTQSGDYVFVMSVSNRTIACLIPNGTPVLGNQLLGQLIEIVQGQAKSLNSSCSATLVARGGGANNTVTPPPAQGINATLPAQVGDTWQITANGFQPWTVTFTGLEDGDPVGTATQSGVRGDALAVKQNTGEYAFAMQSGNRVLVCLIPANAQATGATFAGKLYELVANNQSSPLRDLNTPCSATLTARNGTGGTLNPPMQSTVTAPVQSLVANFPPKVGQTWTVTIDGLAPWVITFREIDKDGDPNGTAVQSGVSRPAVAFASDGIKVFLMAGANNTNYYCLFAANVQPQGATFSGGQGASKVGDGQVTSLGKSCTATLNSQALMALYKSEHTRANLLSFLPIKLSPLF
ncbi:MAG: hypothetical protein ACK41E_05610 [Deinococcales bacterium]